jgi:hypothetical protein
MKSKWHILFLIAVSALAIYGASDILIFIMDGFYD